MQNAPPFQEGFGFFVSNPGFQPLRGLHPGLCCSALSALGSLCYTALSVLNYPWLAAHALYPFNPLPF
jgi:hypothetical protein